MQTYRDLNLKKLREDAGLDFAHFTYRRGQCSCCYGPLDMADRYWAKGKRPQKVNIKYRPDGSEESWEYDRPLEKVQYILFKNANNGSGIVVKDDTICVWPRSQVKYKAWHYTPRYRVCIEWQFPMEKMNLVLKCLRDQLDADYEILRPESKMQCIEIVCKEDLRETDLPRVFREEV